MIQAKLKNYGAAIISAQKGIEIGDKLQSAKQGLEVSNYARLSLGHFYREANLLNESVRTFDQAISFYQQNNEQLLLYGAYKGLLLTQIARGDLTAASHELASVMESFESHRKKILEESNRNSFFDREQNTYDIAIDFAADKLADPQKAFEYAERSRARSLLDAITSKRQMVYVDEQIDLHFSIVSNPASLNEIQQRLPEQVQIVQFAVLKEKTIIWLISRDRFEHKILPIGEEQLTEKVTDYLRQLAIPHEQVSRRLLTTAKELHQLLIEPLEPFLAPHKMLCLIPDKILHLLPYGALVSGRSGKWLIEDHLMIYAPSTTLFLRCTEEAKTREGERNERLLSVGNPAFDRKAYPALADLPAAASEAAQVAANYENPVLLIGSKAVEEEVCKEMKKADVIHFALHHIPDERSPMLSKMLLAVEPNKQPQSPTNGVLEVYEILQQKLRQTRLVILSACQTGAETYYKGEGAIGLSRCFIAANVPLTIASLWAVDSQSTADLMIQFHRERKQGALSSTAALRSAQLKLLAGEKKQFRHPYYWAAFIATGGYTKF